MAYFDNLIKQSSENDQKNETFEEDKKFRIYHDDIWVSLLRGLKCNVCSKTDLSVQHSNEKRFQFKVQLYCTSCKEVINECYSSPQEKDIIDINLRMTSAFLDMGAGYAGMQKLGSDLNMNRMSDATFTKYSRTSRPVHARADVPLSPSRTVRPIR